MGNSWEKGPTTFTNAHMHFRSHACISSLGIQKLTLARIPGGYRAALRLIHAHAQFSFWLLLLQLSSRGSTSSTKSSFFLTHCVFCPTAWLSRGFSELEHSHTQALSPPAGWTELGHLQQCQRSLTALIHEAPSRAEDRGSMCPG